MTTFATSGPPSLGLSFNSMPNSLRYLVSIVCFILAYFLQIQIQLYIDDFGFLILYPTVFATAWFLGIGPAFIMVSSTLLLTFFSSKLASSNDILRICFFFLNSSCVIWIIHRHQKTEWLLHEREERLHLATESSQIGIWEIDLKMGKVITSLQHNRLYGLDEALIDWRMKDFITRIHPDDQMRVSKAITVANTSGELSVQYRVIWPDKSVHWLEASGKMRYDNKKIPVRMLGTITDITEKKKTEESLHEALFYRDEFLSIASHELKTPLTSLKLQSQLFKRSIRRKEADAYSPERVERLVDQADRQVSRLVRLVDDMLDISRIRTGKLSFSKEMVNVTDLAIEVVERMKPQFSDSGREVPVLFFEDICHASCDKLRIEQVITNLLNNAYRYGKGMPVKVIIRKKGRKVEIGVEDSGIGIAPENFDKIFNRFNRAVPASEVSGMGLGLYIAKQIIDGHGGKFWVESELNKGSTFKFDIPYLK